MKIIETEIPEIVVLEPRLFGDPRGFFLEAFNAKAGHQVGVKGAGGAPVSIVQINHSHSVRDTLRGLHYQEPHGQGKMIWVVSGAVYDVAVDIRRGSPTFGRYVSVELSEENHRAVWIPAGFAHGFAVLSEQADFMYACDDYYAPECEHAIRWDDPQIGIPWPVSEPIISERDGDASFLSDAAVLPGYFD